MKREPRDIRRHSRYNKNSPHFEMKQNAKYTQLLSIMCVPTFRKDVKCIEIDERIRKNYLLKSRGVRINSNDAKMLLRQVATQKISLFDLFEVIENSSRAKRLIYTNKYVFVDGYIIENNASYVKKINGKYILTTEAICNIDKYSINLLFFLGIDYWDILCRDRAFFVDLFPYSVNAAMYATRNKIVDEDLSDYDKEKLYIEMTLKRLKEEKEGEYWKYSNLGESKIYADEALKHCEKRNVNSSAEFYEYTMLNRNEYSKLKRNRYNKEFRNIDRICFSICIGLGLSFDNAFELCKLDEVILYPSSRYYATIIELIMLKCDITTSNEVLEYRKLQPLGSLSREKVR